MAEPGFFLIQAVELDLSVRCAHGPGAPIPSGGYGGWQTIARKRRISLTEWQGSEPMQWEVPFLLDGLQPQGHGGQNLSQNEKMYILELLSTVSRGSIAPPVVRVFGPPALILSGLDLIITDIQWDRELMMLDQAYENYIRSGGSIIFQRYVADRHLAQVDAASQKRDEKDSKRKSKHKTHRVAHGETLKSIAKEEMGDAGRWKEIADLNKIRDPRSIHVGQLLKLP